MQRPRQTLCGKSLFIKVWVWFTRGIWCTSIWWLFRLRLSWYSLWFICEVKRRGPTCLSADDFLDAFCFVDTLPFTWLISRSAGWLVRLFVSLCMCVCVWMAALHLLRWMEECIANQNNHSSLVFSCSSCYYGRCKELTPNMPQNKDYPHRGCPLQFTAFSPAPLPC